MRYLGMMVVAAAVAAVAPKVAVVAVPALLVGMLAVMALEYVGRAQEIK